MSGTWGSVGWRVCGQVAKRELKDSVILETSVWSDPDLNPAPLADHARCAEDENLEGKKQFKKETRKGGYSESQKRAAAQGAVMDLTQGGTIDLAQLAQQQGRGELAAPGGRLKGRDEAEGKGSEGGARVELLCERRCAFLSG